MAQVQYKSDINADPSSMNTIRRTERNSQANISGWIVLNGKKQTVSHNAETADRDRVKKETSDYTRKYAAPLARSSSVFGEFKKAESGSVQGATVNRRLVEPTNSASMDILYTSLGIVKKRLYLKKTRNENRKGEWLFLALLPIPQVPCQKMLYTATAGTVKENLPVILRRRISALQLPTPIY